MPDRFPRPWSVIEQEHCFVVVDAEGFRIAYVYFETRPPHQRVGDERMTKAQAKAIAARIAKIGA